MRYIDGATQAQISALNTVLTNGQGTDSGTDTTYTDDANKTTDPGWRVVVSGAAIHAATGTTAAQFAKTSSTENWIKLLDASNTSATKATGVRASSTLGTNGIPELLS